jgi:hypothetical protein
LLTLAVCAGSALAQDSQRQRRPFSTMLNVDALMDNYLRVLARKYDLSDEQRAYTEQFVRDRVDAFLDSHHDELADVVDRLFEVRSGAAEISAEELVAWGREVMPLYQEAKIIIVDANSEWRNILTDDQRIIHDEDLRLMNESFATTEDQLQRVITGQMTVDEFRNPYRYRAARQREARVRTAEPIVVQAAPQAVTPAKRAQVQPRRSVVPTDVHRTPPMTAERRATQQPANVQPTPRRTPETKTPADPRGRKVERRPSKTPAGQTNFESEWEAYVRKFIEKYQLNEDQQNQANKILKSCQNQAARYMRSRQKQIERMDQRLAELKNPTDDAQKQEVAKLREAREKLLSPIGLIFERQLKPRLEKLPTRSQREAAESGSRKDEGGNK